MVYKFWGLEFDPLPISTSDVDAGWRDETEETTKGENVTERGREIEGVTG